MDYEKLILESKLDENAMIVLQDLSEETGIRFRKRKIHRRNFSLIKISLTERSGSVSKNYAKSKIFGRGSCSYSGLYDLSKSLPDPPCIFLRMERVEKL